MSFFAGITNAEEPSAPTCAACRKDDGMVDCRHCNGTGECHCGETDGSDEDHECKGECDRCRGAGKVPCEHAEP
jgi:hypothetical protein